MCQCCPLSSSLPYCPCLTKWNEIFRAVAKGGLTTCRSPQEPSGAQEHTDSEDLCVANASLCRDSAWVFHPLIVIEKWHQVYCCCFSAPKSYLTLCSPVDCSMPGLSVPHHLPEFAQVHIHWITSIILFTISVQICYGVGVDGSSHLVLASYGIWEAIIWA